MVFERKGPAALAVVLAGASILVGCGGGSSDSNDSSAASDSGSSTAKTSYGYGGSSSGTGSSAGSATAGTAATVSTATVGNLGKVLVDGNGMTVYLFEKDKNAKSSCYGACAQAWPPVTTKGQPVAKNGATTGKLGTTKRTDGTVQVTYAGRPLYLYAGDSKPGQANGNDVNAFGAQWYALTPSGDKPED